MADVASEPVEETEAPARPKADLVYGFVVGLLYGLAVAVQVFIVVDEITDGALSNDMAGWWRRTTASWRQRRAVDAEVKAAYPWVLWQAHEILDVEGHET